MTKQSTTVPADVNNVIDISKYCFGVCTTHVQCNKITTKLVILRRRSFQREQLLLLSRFLSTFLSFTRLVLVAGRRLGSFLAEWRLGVPRLQTVPVPSCWRLFLDRNKIRTIRRLHSVKLKDKPLVHGRVKVFEGFKHSSVGFLPFQVNRYVSNPSMHEWG